MYETQLTQKTLWNQAAFYVGQPVAKSALGNLSPSIKIPDQEDIWLYFACEQVNMHFYNFAKTKWGILLSNIIRLPTL